jgi:hypothetical protein
MGIAYASNERKITVFAAGALLLSSLALSGCATSTGGSSLMDARAEARSSPRTAYLPVEDLPPKRAEPALTADERSKLQKELIAARDRRAPTAAAPVEPVKP